MVCCPNVCPVMMMQDLMICKILNEDARPTSGSSQELHNSHTKMTFLIESIPYEKSS